MNVMFIVSFAWYFILAAIANCKMMMQKVSWTGLEWDCENNCEGQAPHMWLVVAEASSDARTTRLFAVLPLSHWNQLDP